MPEEMFDRDRGTKIGKQIVLPFSKAVEISLKSLKIRFWRSLITVSSIILAIAFLSSILVSTTMVRALKSGPEKEITVLKSRMEQTSDLEDLQQKLTESDDPELGAKIRRLEEQLGFQAAEAQQKLGALKKELVRAQQLLDRVKLETGEGIGEEEEGAGSTRKGFFAGFEAKHYWLVSLALLVCFVGIINAMLMSVTERFREIGTMKCLGALDSFIVKLFVLESVFQGALGTFLGIVIGTVLSLLRSWALYGSITFRFFPFVGIVACIAVSQAIGTLLTIVAAVFPARAAAKMQPVEALRVDQ